MTSVNSAAHILDKQLKNRIRRYGPMTIAEYMNAAAEFYYSQGDVFGVGGDFTTAPEISQAFGEMIGLWSAVTWQAMGMPKPCQLVECGPGRGTLMADALRAARQVPGFLESVEIYLIERSNALKTIQGETLKGHKTVWHSSISDCPDGPIILIANEFLDALPVRQFEKTKDGWRERQVNIDKTEQFCFTLRTTLSEDFNAPINANIGDIFEVSPAVTEFIGMVAARIVRHGGAALFIDYGHKASALGDTVQAVKGHKFHHILDSVGTADITAHIDFEAVIRAARSVGANIFGPIEQGIWLKRLGISVRGALLAKDQAPSVATELESGIRRLIEPNAMGALFKVVAIVHPGLPSPEGFSQSGSYE